MTHTLLPAERHEGSTPPVHRMTAAAYNGIIEYICPICGRTVRVLPDSIEFVERGDPAAVHTGSIGGVVMGVEVEQ